MYRKLFHLFVLGLTLSLVGSGVAFGRTLNLRISSGGDDAEQHLGDGSMDIASTDLELPYEDDGDPAVDLQIMGLRFVGVSVPRGAVVTNAYLEFEVDSVSKAASANPVNVLIQGERTPDASPIENTSRHLENRSVRTTAAVLWSIPAWTAANDKYQSPDLSAVVQEIVDQEGWAAGNALMLFVTDDPENPSTGLREAESFEGEAAAAPLLVIEVFIPEATEPIPADGAIEVTNALFQWTAGDTAATHNIYVGMSPELTEADFKTAMPTSMYYHLEPFVPGATYYWRVDEVEADGVTVYPGAIWSFTTMPVAAYAPVPADGGVWQRGDTTVSWKAGLGAVSHTVYGGTDQAAVAAGDPNVLLATQAETSLVLPELEPLTVYYWRVDEVDAAGAVVPGAVWSIKVVGANTGSWRTTATAAEPGFLATFVQNGTYDIGTFGGEMTYEFVVRSNPDETQASMALIGRLNFGDTKAGLKYEQWNNTKTYGATLFGVMDYNFQVPNAPGEYTHLIFVSSAAAGTTDLYVNGVLQGSVPAAITLSGQVGIGRAIREDGTFVDDFDGGIYGVAIYDRLLSADEITANSTAFIAGGPEAVTLDLRIMDGADDAEEHLNAGMDITSTDLEIVYEDAGAPATDEQLVGMRWIVPVAKGSMTTKAYLEFQLKEVKGSDTNISPVNVIIEGQLDPNPAAFTTTAQDITNRARTTAQVKWTLPPGLNVGDKFQTPDISPIIEEIISQDGWAGGNALVIILRDDKDDPSTGLRCVQSFNGNAATAPLLHLEILIP